MAQFESSRPQLDAAGIGVAYIAGQSRTGVMGAAKWIRQHGILYPYLCDESRDVIKAYGIYRPLALDGIRVAHPATFLIDPQRVIRHIFVGANQKERMWPEQVLAAGGAAASNEKRKVKNYRPAGPAGPDAPLALQVAAG